MSTLRWNPRFAYVLAETDLHSLSTTNIERPGAQPNSVDRAYVRLVPMTHLGKGKLMRKSDLEKFMDSFLTLLAFVGIPMLVLMFLDFRYSLSSGLRLWSSAIVLLFGMFFASLVDENRKRQ
jgi:hypothetical protein